MLAAGVVAAGGCVSTPAPDRAPSLRVVVISDLNSEYGSTRYATEVGHAIRHVTDSWRPDLVLVAGDMVAGQRPRLSDSTVHAMWEAFDSVVAAPLRAARIPLVVTLGNHDGSAYPAHARDRRIAGEYWRDARARAAPLAFADDRGFPYRYAVRHGEVFIAVWDATNAEASSDDQGVAWLREALASPAARTARHRVVLGHLPLYPVAEGRNRPGDVLANGDSLRRMLEAWGATAFVSGHHHAYFPGRRGSIELLHAGALGGGPRQRIGDPAPPRNTVSVLEFMADSLAITSYGIDADGTLSAIALGDLPPVICGHSGWVARRDVRAPRSPCNR